MGLGRRRNFPPFLLGKADSLSSRCGWSLWPLRKPEEIYAAAFGLAEGSEGGTGNIGLESVSVRVRLGRRPRGGGPFRRFRSVVYKNYAELS